MGKTRKKSYMLKRQFSIVKLDNPLFFIYHNQKEFQRVRRIFLVFFILTFSLSAFAERVISPVEGRFANKQFLVLSLSEGEEAFYSYTSTNPLTSGFAYDGPVLIDMSGDVSLRITVTKGSEKEEYKINYTVTDLGNPFANGTAEKSFIDRIETDGMLVYNGEGVINIPKTLAFYLGDGEKPLMSGGTLSVSADNKLSRYIPCNLTNGNSRWRFIIFLSADSSGTFAQSSVPFEISDWETFTFTGKNLIWCIDDGLWSASKESVVIDRSSDHVISWQDVAYKAGNPVETFLLPKKPVIAQDKFDKAVSFSLDGDLRYRLKILSSGAAGEAPSDQGLYSSVTFDSFYGDFVSATAVFEIYCDGLYQGNLSSYYEIDRQPPLPPKFVASEPGEYARRDVSLSVESEKDAKIYLSVLGPYTVNSNSYIDNNSEFDYIGPGEYFLYKSQPVELRAGVEKTVCYKAFAYSEDTAGNVSAVSSYKVIIDEFNYFLDASAPDFAADGSRLHPFNSFEQILKVINQGKFVHFFVSGSVNLPKGPSVISSNCSFTGMQDASFVLTPSSYVIVQDASLELQNCVIQKEIDNKLKSDQRLFVMEKAAASFEDCEIIADFDSSGTALSSDSSIISFKNSGLTVRGAAYACAVSGLNSKISMSASHVSSIADTAVNFSVKGGTFDLRSSVCKVISHLGRIVEASASNIRLSGNKFEGDFDQEKRLPAVWRDEKSMLLEDKNNTVEGFKND